MWRRRKCNKLCIQLGEGQPAVLTTDSAGDARALDALGHYVLAGDGFLCASQFGKMGFLFSLQ